jgi:hypothetical protein
LTFRTLRALDEYDEEDDVEFTQPPHPLPEEPGHQPLPEDGKEASVVGHPKRKALNDGYDDVRLFKKVRIYTLGVREVVSTMLDMMARVKVHGYRGPKRQTEGMGYCFISMDDDDVGLILFSFP